MPGELRPCRSNGVGIGFLLAFAVLFPGTRAFAGNNYAVVVTGASGGEAYAAKYDGWRRALVATLHDRFHYPDDHVFALAEREAPGVALADAVHVRQVFAELRQRLMPDDLLLIVLIGHGTSLDADDGKFNLVGPDLTASQWSELLKPLPGHLVFVDTSSASFPFLHKIAGPGRVVLTATDSTAQQFETIFPEFLMKALDDPSADTDKNGRVSIYEAFAFASAAVRQWYEQKGQLSTERALLDDNGDGVGREAQMPGPDGALARATYLEAIAPAAGDTAVAALRRRQAELEAEIEALKARQPTMNPDAYQAELERLLLELARISAELRVKS